MQANSSNKTNTKISKEKHSTEVRDKLAPVIDKYLALIPQVQNIIFKITSENLVPRRRIEDAEYVSINLLTRLSNELEALEMLCASGYSLQAFSIACTVYEQVWMIYHIGGNDNLAGDWLDHKDRAPFIFVSDLIKAGMTAMIGRDPTEDELAAEKKIYQTLCWGKHANPLFQKQIGFTESIASDNVPIHSFAVGPSASADSIYWTKMLVSSCIERVTRALQIYINRYMKNKEKVQFSQILLDDLGQEYNDAYKEEAVGYPEKANVT